MARVHASADGYSWPPEIIVQTDDLMYEFEVALIEAAIQFTKDDFSEVVRQIFDLLLEFGPAAQASYHLLPDTSRLMGVMDLPQSDPRWPKLNAICMKFAYAIHERVDGLKLWRTYVKSDGVVVNDCPYYFYKWARRNVILSHLPF